MKSDIDQKGTLKADLSNSKKHLSDWLRDAYAMEHQAIEMFEKEAARIQHYPELKEQILRHLETTKKQAEKLEDCLTRLGEDTSLFKTSLGKLIGTAQALSGLIMTDEIVKGSVAMYVFKHYEIGNYKVLIEAAKDAGAPDIAKECEAILREEEAMAAWMLNYLPQVVRQFLQRDALGQDAKR